MSVTAVTADLASFTITTTVDGALIESRPMTEAEIAQWSPPPNAEADAYDALADVCDASPIASTRDLAPHYRVLATALRSQ